MKQEKRDTLGALLNQHVLSKLTCQHCKYQSNKPSRCSKQARFVSRKAPICIEFKGKR